MKNSKFAKVLLSGIILANVLVLTSCKSEQKSESETEQTSEEVQDETILENDGELEIQVEEDEETFGE